MGPQTVTIFTMVVAFFSLNTSMFTNIMEQSKELGILRALGISRGRVYRIYAYEAFVLLISSAILGVRAPPLGAAGRCGQDPDVGTRCLSARFGAGGTGRQCAIGLLVGWSISAQRAIFTEIPLSFEFPGDLVLIMVVVSVLCSLLATVVPIRNLMRMPIVNIMRL